MNIQLSVEEGLDYQKFDSELAGFSAGVAHALDFVRQRKLSAILQARKVADQAQPANSVKPEEGE